MIEDMTKSENIYGILKALESESDNGVSDEARMLEEIFRSLDQLENGKNLKTDLIDLIQLTRMDYFAKGMKLGARLSDLLLNSPLFVISLSRTMFFDKINIQIYIDVVND